MYITLTGLDGSGKDTVFEKIVNQVNYEFKNLKILKMREPGGTPNAEIIRSVLTENKSINEKINKMIQLKDKKINNHSKKLIIKSIERMKKFNKIDALTEVYLFAASRADTNVMVKNKREKNLILGRRSVACSIAYQASARKKELIELGINNPLEFVWDINKNLITDSMPDTEILIDISEKVCIERTTHRGNREKDRFDQLKENFFKKARNGYYTFYESLCPYKYLIINGEQNQDSVFNEVYKPIKKLILDQCHLNDF